MDSAGISSLGCLSPVYSVALEFTSSSGSLNYPCVSNYPCDLSTGSASTCRCVSSDSGIYTYSYSFIANEDIHKGGSMKCGIDCFRPTRNITYATNDSCDNLQFEATSPTATTTVATTEVTPACSHANADVTLKCPAVWRDHDAARLTCEVSASSVGSAACPGVSGQISFHFTSRAGLQAPVCILSSYLDAACDGVFNAHGCRCKEKTANGTYILEYTVTADVTKHEGGSWACVPVCLDFNYIPVAKTTLTAGSCTNVHFESPTVTMTTETREEKVSTTTISRTTARTTNGTTTITAETTITTTNTTTTVLP